MSKKLHWLPKSLLQSAFVAATFFLAQTQGNCLGLFSIGEFRDIGTLVRIPESFGKIGGDYLCTDFCFMAIPNELHTVYRIPRGGGRASVFATGIDAILSDGFFLPASWGKDGGKYATLGWVESGLVNQDQSQANATLSTSFQKTKKSKKGKQSAATTAAIPNTKGCGKMHIYTSNGKAEIFLESADTKFSFGAIVPDGFGDLSGELLVTTQTDVIKRITKDKTLKDFCKVPAALMLRFAPQDFGGHGKKLFVTSGTDGRIFAVTADGKADLFATIPLTQEQLSAHTIVFSPPGYLPGIKESLMLVSIRSARTGGGLRGDVVAVDSTGKIVATMRPRMWSRAFEPSGLQFSSDGKLFICDSGIPAIHVASPWDFAPAPQ